jgi:hypothetical protein
VTATVRIGDTLEELDEENARRRAKAFQVALVIDGLPTATLPVNAFTKTADLAPDHAFALTRALARGSRVEFVAGRAVWRLSRRGALAVLARMDDFQGRSGTRGAIVRKGTKPEQRVRLFVPPPVIRAQSLPPPLPGDERFGKEKRGELLNALKRADTSARCTLVQEGSDWPIMVRRLSQDNLLVSTPCCLQSWYCNDIGIGYWVVRDTPPFKASLVTLSGDELDESTIRSSLLPFMTIGCRIRNEWVWNGDRFLHALSTSTGLCKAVAADGTWDLPTLVTETRGP